MMSFKNYETIDINGYGTNIAKAISVMIDNGWFIYAISRRSSGLLDVVVTMKKESGNK